MRLISKLFRGIDSTDHYNQIIGSSSKDMEPSGQVLKENPIFNDYKYRESDTQYSCTATCSTCATDSEKYSEVDSTLTERSFYSEASSTRSSTRSDDTIVNGHLHCRFSLSNSVAPIDRMYSSKNVDTFQASNKPVMAHMAIPAKSNVNSHMPFQPTLLPQLSYSRTSQASQSLVDLAVHHNYAQRRNSTGKALPIETSL